MMAMYVSAERNPDMPVWWGDWFLWGRLVTEDRTVHRALLIPWKPDSDLYRQPFRALQVFPR